MCLPSPNTELLPAFGGARISASSMLWNTPRGSPAAKSATAALQKPACFLPPPAPQSLLPEGEGQTCQVLILPNVLSQWTVNLAIGPSDCTMPSAGLT